jgi:hypothetical protein
MSELMINVTEDDRAIARRVHSMFAAKFGADHIASDVALAHLAAITRQYPVRSAIEFGSGIGTITTLLLARLPRDARIVGTERRAWCREQFEQNIPASERSRIELLPKGREDIVEPFDLVVIDGRVSAGSSFAREGSIVFIEGTRTEAWERVAADLAGRGLQCALSQRSERRRHFSWRPLKWRWLRRRRIAGRWLRRAQIMVPTFKVKDDSCSIGIVERRN